MNKQKTKRGHSDGSYKAFLKNGVSNRFQAAWSEVDNRAEWLEDLGACDGATTLKVKCLRCDVKMACYLGTIQTHELSKKHKNQDKQREAAAAGQQQMQQHADAQQTKVQHDPASRTLFSSVLRALFSSVLRCMDGPSLTLSTTRSFLRLTKLPMCLSITEDERMFSALKYLKKNQRNHLKDEHLTACAQGFKSPQFSFMSFP